MRNQLSVIFGSFNAERFWRNPLNCSLPSFRDEQADNIVEAMDELQFAFVEGTNNTLVTKFEMNQAHMDYLSDLGFKLTNKPLQDTNTGSEQSVTTEFYKSLQRNNWLAPINDRKVAIHPYAIVPGHFKLINLLDLGADAPEESVVMSVNSKVFSTVISNELAIGPPRTIISSADQLKHQAGIMLNSSSIIIKDPFGVSGNGNILIKKEITLRSIVKHLQTQEQQGKVTEFVLEPFLDKKTDFSCQAFIAADGSFNIRSFNIMHNDKFRFSGIEIADDAFIDILNRLKYLDYIAYAARKIFEYGYFGPVCFDSMILTDGKLIPIVEINARKSMGHINHSISMFLKTVNQNLKCRMMTLNFLVAQKLSFNYLLEKLRQNGLLFSLNKPSGIFPLSANTVDINTKVIANGSFKARLYYQVVYNTAEEYDLIQNKLNEFMESLNLKTV